MSDEISLELELENRSKDDKVAESLWHRYMAMKDFLQREYYPWIQANCPFFTDHGQRHVESVIETASSLIERLDELTPLDLFLLLSAIVWHDAGMVYERTNHQDRVTEMLMEIRKLGFIDVTTQRLTSEIAQSHSGEHGLAIPRRVEYCSIDSKSYAVYPKALAAVVRFADEVSENRSRVSMSIRSRVPEKNCIYWDYAYCIAGSKPDPSRERVIVSIELHDDSPLIMYSCPATYNMYADKDGKICLIQYVVCRLQKMNNERSYCAQEFKKYSTIRNIQVRLTAIKAGSRMNGYEDEIILGEDGLGQQQPYPNISIYEDFFTNYPCWHPERMREVLS
jgi:hypothetical protein